MGKFRYTAEIFAPPERVWTATVDVERWPEWTPTVTRVKRMEDGPLAVGSKTKIWQPKLTPVVWRVTELDEAAGIFIWVTGKPGIQIAGMHQVEPTLHGCQLTLTLDYTGLLGPFMAWQLKDLNWEYLTREAAGLKRFCEQ
jgi:uncharacterized protein YndB with AHSA1/START domain